MNKSLTERSRLTAHELIGDARQVSLDQQFTLVKQFLGIDDANVSEIYEENEQIITEDKALAAGKMTPDKKKTGQRRNKNNKKQKKQ